MNSEIIGWIGSTIILISFIPKSVNKIRILNSIGCVIWVIYGFITKAPSVWIMNFLVFFINLFQLIKDKKKLKKKY